METAKKEYLPINIYKVSAGENDWIVGRSKNDVVDYYRLQGEESPLMKDIRLQNTGYLWKSIEDEDELKRILDDKKTIEVRRDIRNGLLCAYKIGFAEVRLGILNDETFVPHLISSSAV